MMALARKVVEAALDRAERGLDRVRWLAAEAGLAQHLPRWTDAAIRVCLATGVGGGRVTESLERAADKLERALGDEGWTALQDMRCERDALEFERDCARERVEVVEALLQTDRAALEAEVQVLREERDGALAGNAEVFDAVCRGWSDEITRAVERLARPGTFLVDEPARAATEIEPWQAWGEGRGLQPGEAVLPRSHPGARRVSVRRTSDGGVAVRTVDDDGVTPIGPSVYLREAALRTFLDALRDYE
jgi:hypothetical protein